MAVDFQNILPPLVGIPIRIKDGSIWIRCEWACIIEVFIFDMTKQVSQKIIQEAAEVIPCKKAASIYIGFEIDVLMIWIIPEIVLCLEVIIGKSNTQVELINNTDHNLRRNIDRCDRTKLHTQVPPDRDAV